MYDIKLSRRIIFFILFLIFIIGLVFRLIYFKSVTFGYDQARDAFMAIDIVSRDPLKITGPTTEILGLNHGVLYWYLLAPFYYFSNGNIYVVRIVLILINLLGIFSSYYVAKKIFKNNLLSLLSALTYSVSFEAVQYSRWMSNPAPALVIAPLLFYCYWLISHKEDKGIYWFILLFPIAIHFEFLLIYHLIFFIPLLSYLLIKKQLKINVKNLLLSSFVASIIMSPFFIEQIKYGFKGVKSLFTFFLNNEVRPVVSFTNNTLLTLDRVVNSFYLNISGINPILAGILILIIIYGLLKIAKKNNNYSRQFKLLLFWLIAPLLAPFFFNNSFYYLTIGSLYATILLTLFYFMNLLEGIKNKKLYIFLLILFVFLSNSFLNFFQNKRGETLFSVQTNMLLSDEMKVIDYIYLSRENKQFAINTVTSPLFINTVWAYLFNYYGKIKYQYMPAWLGYPQVDVFGGNVSLGLTPINVEYGHLDNQTGSLLYLIFEPREGIPEQYINAYNVFENTRSILLERKTIGTFIVEKRRLFNEKLFVTDQIFKIAKTGKVQ